VPLPDILLLLGWYAAAVALLCLSWQYACSRPFHRFCGWLCCCSPTTSHATATLNAALLVEAAPRSPYSARTAWLFIGIAIISVHPASVPICISAAFEMYYPFRRRDHSPPCLCSPLLWLAFGGALAAAGFAAGVAWLYSWVWTGKGYFLGLLDETHIAFGSSWLAATSVTLLTASVIRFNCCPPAFVGEFVTSKDSLACEEGARPHSFARRARVAGVATSSDQQV
jgi:hypothetical protein